MSALCSERMLVCVHSFVHSGLGVKFAVKFVLKGFDLASRIKSGRAAIIKKQPF